MLDEIRGTTEGADHASENLGGRAGGKAAGRQDLAGESDGHLVKAGIAMLACKEVDGILNLDSVAGGRGARLVHVGYKSRSLQASAVRNGDQAFSEDPRRGEIA